MLGHYIVEQGSNYKKAARQVNGSYFDLPSYIRENASKDLQWEINAQAIRDAVNRGDEIIIGTEIHWKDAESWLFREIDLLWDEFNLALVDNIFYPNH